MTASESLIAYDSIRVGSWADLWDLYQSRFRNRSNIDDTLWVYRGLPSCEFALLSSLDRITKRFGIKREQAPLVEEWILADFQRKAANADPGLRLPPNDRHMEWFALMRHYGAPTRLTDWTYSFFVALFFAAESADADFTVWAVDARKCNSLSRKALPESEASQPQFSGDPYIQEPDTFRALFSREDPVRLVYRINPYLLNQRLEIQRGLFLCPGDIRSTFVENLMALQDLDAEPCKWIAKVDIPQSVQKEVLEQVHQMGISSSSLFPGIDGFARSYNSSCAFLDLLMPRRLTRNRLTTHRESIYER